MVGKKDNQENIIGHKQVCEFYLLLLNTIMTKIKETYGYMFDNNSKVDIELVKSEFLKNFGVVNILMKKSYILDCNILQSLFNTFLDEVLNIFEFQFRCRLH